MVGACVAVDLPVRQLVAPCLAVQALCLSHRIMVLAGCTFRAGVLSSDTLACAGSTRHTLPLVATCTPSMLHARATGVDACVAEIFATLVLVLPGSTREALGKPGSLSVLACGAI
jgi:hypothetical protein